jgi:hypothetical protein
VSAIKAIHISWPVRGRFFSDGLGLLGIENFELLKDSIRLLRSVRFRKIFVRLNKVDEFEAQGALVTPQSHQAH